VLPLAGFPPARLEGVKSVQGTAAGLTQPNEMKAMLRMEAHSKGSR
jgi:hypothetical protein